MKTQLTAIEFERLIERVFRLLEAKNTKVTWNAYLPDRDAPDAARQIDILIEKNRRHVLVECRHRKRPQGIEWIEQLISKRISVGAFGVIAVSSSGFTKNAVTKAANSGIILRNLWEISDKEVATWTNFQAMEAYFVDFFEVNIDVSLLKSHRALVSDPARLRYKRSKLNPIHSLLDKITTERGDEIFESGSYEETFSLDPKSVLLDRAPVQFLAAQIKARARIVEIQPLSIAVYSEGQKLIRRESVVVETTDHGETELITSRRRVGWTVDLSSVVPPKNCCFHDIRVLGVKIGGEMVVNVVGGQALNPFGDLDAQMDLRFV